MAEEIPLAYDKTTGGSPVGLKEIPPGNQLGNQWLAMPPGYIDGLTLEWVSGSSIRVAAGTCTIPGVGTITFASATTKSSLSLTANTWYHIYGYLSGSVPDIEIVTAAPSAPYSGGARNKAGDTTRRYLGSIRANTSGQVMRFEHNPITGYIAYVAHVNASPLYVLSAGTATATTAVSCATAVPATSRLAAIFADNSDNAAFVRIGNSDLGTLSGSNYMGYLTPNAMLVSTVQLDASQAFTYGYSSAPSVGNFNARVVGYFYIR